MLPKSLELKIKCGNRFNKVEIVDLLFFEDKKIYALNSPGCNQYSGNENCQNCLTRIEKLCVEFTHGKTEFYVSNIY